MLAAQPFRPRVRLHANGRISFPGAVQYIIAAGDEAGRSLPYPPTTTSHPAPASPVALSGAGVARALAEGRIRPIPASLPFRIEVLDLSAYERLSATGWLYDPRHTGNADVPAEDNRRAPGG